MLLLLVLVLLLLLRGIKTDSLLGHTFLLITQKFSQVLLTLNAGYKTFLKLIFSLFVLNKYRCIINGVRSTCIIRRESSECLKS